MQLVALRGRNAGHATSPVAVVAVLELDRPQVLKKYIIGLGRAIKYSNF
jgi:hypothetical protein